MDVLDAIFSRHSYRGRFQPAPVPRDDLKLILEAGLAAPSGCNRQTTSLIAVDDQMGMFEQNEHLFRSQRLDQSRQQLLLSGNESVHETVLVQIEGILHDSPSGTG